MVRCSASTTRAPIASRMSARGSARSTGPHRQRWVPPTLSAQKRHKQTQQPLRPLPQEQTMQPRHFRDQRVPRRWCAARLRSRVHEATADRTCHHHVEFHFVEVTETIRLQATPLCEFVTDVRSNGADFNSFSCFVFAKHATTEPFLSFDL